MLIRLVTEKMFYLSPVYLSTCLPMYPYYVYICSCIRLLVRLSVCLSICLHICLSVCTLSSNPLHHSNYPFLVLYSDLYFFSLNLAGLERSAEIQTHPDPECGIRDLEHQTSDPVAGRETDQSIQYKRRPRFRGQYSWTQVNDIN